METRKVDGRRERSRVTRERIVQAATQLFLSHGYVATTIEDVAERAGLAVQTVYYVFGTKPALLAAVLDASIAGDAEPVAVLDRGWVESLRAAPDAAAAVKRLVEATVSIVARATPIYEVVRRASADADVSALLAANRRARREDQRRLIDILAASGFVSRADVEAASDAVYGLLNEEVFQLLTVDCGWDIPRFTSWATALMTQQLAGADAAQR